MSGMTKLLVKGQIWYNCGLHDILYRSLKKPGFLRATLTIGATDGWAVGVGSKLLNFVYSGITGSTSMVSTFENVSPGVDMSNTVSK
ncbi:hypothetical protein VE03_02149 [Pseudogymnoascus sp. 23342-1-I1]|nr:hypothetical protein VE03_02149 [Pseudogymnoascus sp. 23342-1-I1]